jgi:glycerophosphoryl diester phosphodiesterase
VLLSEFAFPGMRAGQLPFGAAIAGPGRRVVKANPWLVDKLHEGGYRVYVWTVNSPDDVALMTKLGVDGIISDRPRFVLDTLGR